jgi:hypothetical protein
MSEITYIHRDNIGYDFGSLHDAHKVLLSEATTQGRVVVLNSSMLNLASSGFCKDPVLDQLVSPSSKHDLYGITSSYECKSYHVQSYFYSMSSNFFNSDVFDSFLSRYINGLAATKLSPRSYAIKHGELRLTNIALKAGYSASSIFNDFCVPASTHYATMTKLVNAIESLLGDNLPMLMLGPATYQPLKISFLSEWISKPGLQTNISQSCWAMLIANGFHFIKRELLESQADHIPIAPSAPALLLPLLEALRIEIPTWSDIRALPYILYASRSAEKDASC